MATGTVNPTSTTPAMGGAVPAKPATPVVGPGPTPGTVTPLPEVVIDSHKFEGKDVAGTIFAISGINHMDPRSERGNSDDTVLTIDDIVSIQMDLKVVGVAYKTDRNGTITRVCYIRPISNSPAVVVDVVRDRDTRVR